MMIAQCLNCRSTITADDLVECLPTTRCGECLASVPTITLVDDPSGAQICPRCAAESLREAAQ